MSATESQEQIQLDMTSQHSSYLQQDTQVRTVSPTRDLLLAYRNLMQKLTTQVPDAKRKSNYHASALRIFSVTDVYKQEFMSNDQIRQTFGGVVSACYIFKFRIPCQTYNHGLYLRVNGYAPRRVLDVFARKIIDMFTCDKCVSVKNATPQIRRNISIFDYLQSLYVLDQNLLVNYANQIDAIPFSLQMMNHQQHQEVANLTSIMKRDAQTILENMIQMPSRYQNSQLYYVLQLPNGDYKAYMRMTTINEFVLQLCQDAYNIALQSSQFSPNDIQQLMDPLTRRSLINTVSNDRVVKAVQLLLQQRFQQSFVHPHPYINLSKSDLGMQRPFDAIVFDPRFLLPLLMCARWFAKSCMRQESAIQNNQAHLMLYGSSGAGKSFLLSILSSNIPTYRYLTSGRFQNPDILSSSLFYIDEFDTIQLASNQYKALFDIKAPVKVDLKNLHPENVSENVPCMISTNDEVFTVLRNLPNRKIPPGQPQINQSSVEAALRRLYIVPMKLGQYDKLHSKLNRSSKYYSEAGLFNNNFEEEPSKLNRIFNFMVTFAMFQQDITSFQFDPKLQNYFIKLLSDFTMTVFGMFYVTNKKKVDDILLDVEKVMVQQDVNDTEYLCQVALSAGNLQSLLIQFLLDMTNLNTRINQAIIKESTVPWPVKMYYLKNEHFFLSKVHCQCNDFHQFLNQEVLSFIVDRSIEPFKFDDEELNPYPDIDNSSSNDESIIAASDRLSLVNQFIDVPLQSQQQQQQPPPIFETTLDSFILGKREHTVAFEVHGDFGENTFDHCSNMVATKRARIDDEGNDKLKYKKE